MQDMQDEADRADADRVHEGYQERYRKERRASYMLVMFGLLAFVAVAIVMFMHRYVNTGASSNLVNLEPAAGSTPQPAGTPSLDTKKTDTNMVQPQGDNPPQDMQNPTLH